MSALIALLKPYRGKHRATPDSTEGRCISCENYDHGLPGGRHCGRCWCC